MSRQASGFPCPMCKSAELADIISADMTHILELRCSECSWEWAVEL